MKLLNGLHMAFGSLPGDGKIKDFLRLQAVVMGSEEFCDTMCRLFGANKYNQFMDYGLLAIKLAHFYIWEKRCFSSSADSYYHYLIADDRHDMWKNVPVCIDKLAIQYPAHSEMIWSFFSKALIDCLNVHGTGDVAHLISLPED
jgi:hypothetical protein